jgi:hypothetical protein
MKDRLRAELELSIVKRLNIEQVWRSDLPRGISATRVTSRCAFHSAHRSLLMAHVFTRPASHVRRARPELDAETAATFQRVQPGAFILFGRNIQTATQLRKLIDDLRALSAVEPIITIDQEGGRVSRLKLLGNEPPNANQLRDKDDVALIRQHGEITAKLLRVFGFNLDLCPVLDISFDDEADNSLRGRCYGNDVAQVNRNAGPSTRLCARAAFFPAANISPATRARRSMRITSCPRSTCRARNSRRTNSLSSALSRRGQTRWIR